jgi:hypothetical protein
LFCFLLQRETESAVILPEMEEKEMLNHPPAKPNHANTRQNGANKNKKKTQ